MEIARERQHLVYLARLAGQAKRYDEVVESMKEVAKLGIEFTAEERSILSVGCTNLVKSRRVSRAILSSIDQFPRGNNEQQHVKQIMISKIELEVSSLCSDIIDLIDEQLIPSCTTVESSVYFYQMKGDFYRYLAEFKTEDEKKDAADLSLKAYEFASKTAEAADLSPGHPIRLGLALNFSVLYHDIMNSPQKACDLARQAFDDASSELDNLGKDSTLIMKLLWDNLDLWRSSDIVQDGFKHVKRNRKGYFSPPAY